MRGTTGQAPSTSRRRSARAPLLAAALAGLLLAAPAAAQDREFDRQDLPERPEDGAPADVAPVSSDASGRPVRDQGRRRDPRFVPEDEVLDPSLLPGDEPEEEGPSLWDEIKLKHRGRVRVGAGHDTNVFRAERDRTGDGFGRAKGEVGLLAAFPQGAQVFAEVKGESLVYLEREQANEHFASAFLEVFQPLTPWFDVGAQNAFEYSRQNLLDDNGDLFPRGRFGSSDEEVRVYAIARPDPDVALEAGAAYRWKNYEENSGVDSLDYEEARFDASIGWKVAQDPRTRVKLKYRFRRRDYREFRARARDGTIGLTEPLLDLHRHQLNLTFFQVLRVAGQEVRLIAGLGAAYNRDLHENDRSYRELSGSAQVAWSPVPDMTTIELGVRGLGRDFIVRKRPGRGGHLRHRLLDVSLGVWQRLRRDLPLAVFAEATFTDWRSGDPLEGYERFVIEGGVELVW